MCFRWLGPAAKSFAGSGASCCALYRERRHSRLPDAFGSPFTSPVKIQVGFCSSTVIGESRADFMAACYFGSAPAGRRACQRKSSLRTGGSWVSSLAWPSSRLNSQHPLQRFRRRLDFCLGKYDPAVPLWEKCSVLPQSGATEYHPCARSFRADP